MNKEKNKEVVIFDIDGCIMPNVFQNYGWTKDQNRVQVFEEINNKGKTVSLFPGFIDYFEKHCKDALKIYFVTGRQQMEYGALTLLHLTPLFPFKYDFDIVWYPPDGVHIEKKYFQWKASIIEKIMQKHIKKGVFFTIFDDLPNYFKKVKLLQKKFKASIFLIKIDSDSKWRVLC